jgi:hypothetical protein
MRNEIAITYVIVVKSHCDRSMIALKVMRCFGIAAQSLQSRFEIA